MKTVTTFTFKAYDAEYIIAAEKETDAMVAANKALLWSNPDFKDGVWMEAGANSYMWVEGNYFD